MQVKNETAPRPELAQAFFSDADHGPMVMVNLLKFKDKAEYEDGRATTLTGREAYQIYGRAVTGILPMFGGQAIGISAGAALGGYLLASSGLPAAALVLAVILAAILALVCIVRERPEEKLLPWSRGRASQRNLDLHVDALWPIIRDLFALKAAAQAPAGATVWRQGQQVGAIHQHPARRRGQKT